MREVALAVPKVALEVAKNSGRLNSSPNTMKIDFIFSQPFNKALSIQEPVFPLKEIQIMELFWKSEGKKIEKTLKQITGYSFTEKTVKCYLNPIFCVSDPLSLKIENVLDMENNLVHELIHVLLTQNEVGKTKGWKKLMKEYNYLPPVVKVHIAVHRIHYILCNKLYQNRLDSVIKYSKKPLYMKAWHYVLNDWQKIDSLLSLKVL